MEFNRGLLYHVESLEQDDTYGDYIIGRIPEAVRRQLNLQKHRATCCL